MAKDFYKGLEQRDILKESKARYTAFLVVFSLLNLAYLCGIDAYIFKYPGRMNSFDQVLFIGSMLCVLSILLFIMTLAVLAAYEQLAGKQSALTPYLFGAVIAFLAYAIEYVAYAFLYPMAGAILAKPALMLKETKGLAFLLIALLMLLASAWTLRPKAA
jgi:hypothetical protein